MRQFIFWQFQKWNLWTHMRHWHWVEDVEKSICFYCCKNCLLIGLNLNMHNEEARVHLHLTFYHYLIMQIRQYFTLILPSVALHNLWASYCGFTWAQCQGSDWQGSVLCRHGQHDNCLLICFWHFVCLSFLPFFFISDQRSQKQEKSTLSPVFFNISFKRVPSRSQLCSRLDQGG